MRVTPKMSIQNTRPSFFSSNNPRPANIGSSQDRELRTKTIRRGMPMGLLLALTYPVDFTVIT